MAAKSIKYIIAFLLLYLTALAILYLQFRRPPGEFLVIGFIFGIIFPFTAWLFFRKSLLSFPPRPFSKREWLALPALLLFLAWYITFGTKWIDQIFAPHFQSSARLKEVYILFKKLFVFVFVPFLVYASLGFKPKDFGFTPKLSTLGNRRILAAFIVLSAMAIAFQIIAGQKAAALFDGHLTFLQLSAGFILCFAWNFVEAGVVEEFFFRALLQERISVLLRSQTGAILVSGVIFGLVHAPGLYLRGATSEGVTDQLPFLFWACYTISIMSFAGIFLGIIWSRTKNIWIIVFLHGLIDVIPNLEEFIKTWHIK